jgi:hypothetical protein
MIRFHRYLPHAARDDINGIEHRGLRGIALKTRANSLPAITSFP